MLITMVPWLIWVWFFGLCTAVIAERKGLSGFSWFWIGGILGPIGIIIAVCHRGLPICPACGTRMKAKDALACAACGRLGLSPVFVSTHEHAGIVEVGLQAYADKHSAVDK